MIDRDTLKDIDSFHVGRIDKILGAKPPARLAKAGKILIHLIPRDSIQNPQYYDISKFADQPNFLRPNRKALGSGPSYCFDGLLSTLDDFNGDVLAYSLLFRTGIVEWVDSFTLDNPKIELPIFDIEQEIVTRTTEFLALQKSIGIEGPIIYYLDFFGINAFRLPFHNSLPIQEENLCFPRMEVETAIAVEDALKSRFDQLWNAFGSPRSLHYDEKTGKWNGELTK